MIDTSKASIFESTDEQAITDFLGKSGVTSILATNGVYDKPQDIVLPTTVAAFQYLVDSKKFLADAAITIALNSDISLRNALVEQGASQEKLDAQEDQKTRARKLWPALADQFPDRRIVILFYDEPTPEKLYQTIAGGGMTRIANLHKYAYGVPQDDGKLKEIKGASAAETVYGFPLPKDIAHMHSSFWNATPEVGDKQYTVVDLTNEVGPHGMPYLTNDNKILFPRSNALQKYAAKPAAPDDLGWSGPSWS